MKFDGVAGVLPFIRPCRIAKLQAFFGDVVVGGVSSFHSGFRLSFLVPLLLAPEQLLCFWRFCSPGFSLFRAFLEMLSLGELLWN